MAVRRKDEGSVHGSAIIIEAPGQLTVRKTALSPLESGDVMVRTEFSGVSTGTEKLLWNGTMPTFPGMGYPLVPGYESVGEIVDAGADHRDRIGEWVFVPGASCYRDARGLFGGACRTLIVPGARALPVPRSLGQEGVLFALAATALHAMGRGAAPELIIGHGVLGRLLARLTIASGAPAPVVWETCADRSGGAAGYAIVHPDDDDRHDYRAIYDVSGDAASIDGFIRRLVRGGELILAGFYNQPIAFAFAPAFQREARISVAAEWQPEDLASVRALVGSGALDLGGLINRIEPAGQAQTAYPQAFDDPSCLKMLLDWRDCA
ncbi:chlorophyll synthesis pathway protein BchC [Sphingomonas sp. BGYR3]|uniref:chlorophyll synthesis pathway protein BchC n=1 Tax=Sphingomonas sp. BGYR3 TaxID=2975483 RepID=UPI0021A2B840|nr:chlorophyll synthesis pathway protein BchC [Sphingomonas sp. BGYR3]MDG5487715.1 chlorophyll synthesis pathway protein BchC [Sphingomonas sp. BGYR3]